MSGIIKELQRASLWKKEWQRGFTIFSYVVCTGLFFAVATFGVPEKDHRGNDHVFSAWQRFYKKERDDFFGVPKDNETSV